MLKKGILSAFSFIVLVSIFSIPAFAADFKMQVGSVTGNSVRVRSEPNTSSAVLSQAGKDSLLVVQDFVKSSPYNWYKVICNGKTGYMASDYITLVEDQEFQIGFAAVSDDVVNFRNAPNVDSEIISTLSKNTEVSLVGVYDGWFKVEYNEQFGYLRSDLVTVKGNSSGLSGIDMTAQQKAIVEYAISFLGCGYKYGTANGKTFDCSGFTSYVYKHFGYAIGRSAINQINDGVAVKRSELQPGDILLFCDTKRSKVISHVGLYIGGENGKFIHASTPSTGVIYSYLDTDTYYNKYYIGARRIIK